MFIFVLFAAFFDNKKTRKICVRFHVFLRLSIVSFVTAEMCFKNNLRMSVKMIINHLHKKSIKRDIN